jgi:hypothetical protein
MVYKERRTSKEKLPGLRLYKEKPAATAEQAK